MTVDGLDEFDVENCRVCLDIDQWRKRAARQAFKKTDTPDSSAAKALVSSVVVAAEGASQPGPVPLHSDCPLDTEALGRASWAFLHTLAAYYPVRATSVQQGAMAAFVSALGMFYPCQHCAAYLREELRVLPPQTQGRAELSLWMCRLHNLVNARLGKEQFDCSRVLERWREGRSGC